MNVTDGLTLLRARFGVAEAAPLLLNGLTLGGWGGALTFTGVAGVGVGDQRFELIYTGVREMRWRVYAHEDTGNPDEPGYVWPSHTSTPLIGYAFGRDQHRSPAQLLTERFGLSLYYGALEITPVAE